VPAPSIGVRRIAGDTTCGAGIRPASSRS
jgi:hypothetical protein